MFGVTGCSWVTDLIQLVWIYTALQTPKTGFICSRGLGLLPGILLTPTLDSWGLEVHFL